MDRRAVYVLKMTDSYDFSTMAMDVHMYEDHIRFFDTNRGHMIDVLQFNHTGKGTLW